MKKLAVFLLTLSVVVSMLGFSCTSVYALTSNPDTYCAYFDFEDGQLPHRNDLTSATRSAYTFTADISNTGAKNGTYALHTNGKGWISIPVGRELTAGTTVKVSYWINVVKPNEQNNIRTSLFNASNSEFILETSAITQNQYKQITTSYTWQASDGFLKDIRIYPGRVADNDTEAYIDDISVEILPQEYGTVRYSFDFDDGNLPDTSLLCASRNELTIGVTKDAAFNSSYGLSVTGYGRVKIPMTGTFSEGTKLSVSYKLYLKSSARGQIATGFFAENPNDNKSNWREDNTTAKQLNAWTSVNYTYEWKAADGKLQYIAITPGKIDSSEAKYEAYIDDIIVEVIPPDSTKSLSAKKNVRANVDFETGSIPGGVSVTKNVTTKEVITGAAKNGTYGLHAAGTGRVDISMLDEEITPGSTVNVSFWIKVNTSSRDKIEVNLVNKDSKFPDADNNRAIGITKKGWEKIEYSYTWTENDGKLARVSIQPGKTDALEFDAYLDDIQVSVTPADYKPIDVLFTGINGYRSFVYSNETKDATVVFASYADNALVDAKIEPISLNGGEWTKVPVPNGFDYDKAKTVRVFLWDMTNYSIRPLTIDNTINR